MQKNKNKKKALYSWVVCALLAVVLTSSASYATQDYRGQLLSSSGVAQAGQYDIRFSLWENLDFDDTSDVDSNGNLIGAGWSEVQTVTLDNYGKFYVEVGSNSAVPIALANSFKYLQAEAKKSTDPDTNYIILDPSSDSGIDRRQFYREVDKQAQVHFINNTDPIPTGKEGDEYFVTSNGTASGDIQEEHIHDGTTWIQRPTNTNKQIVDDGVSAVFEDIEVKMDATEKQFYWRWMGGSSETFTKTAHYRQFSDQLYQSIGSLRSDSIADATWNSVWGNTPNDTSLELEDIDDEEIMELTIAGKRYKIIAIVGASYNNNTVFFERVW